MQYETAYSISPEEFTRLFEDGYLVLGPPRPVQQITNITRGVFCIQTSSDIINSTKNTTKMLILLRHLKKDKQIELLTDNITLIKMAINRYQYQNKPIGTLIRAHCMALHPTQQIHLQKTVSSISTYSGWQIQQGDTKNTLLIISRIQSIEKQDIEQEISRIRQFMDALCLIYKVGFFLYHVSHAPICQLSPTVSFGQAERMLEPIKKEDIIRIAAQIQLSREIATTIRGLNQAYVDNYYASRLDRLWATVEELFSGSANHLLKSDEIAAILKSIESTELVNDNKRLGKFADLLKNPNHFPAKGRNERISDTISKLLKRNREETYDEIRKCSEIRGKYGHNIPQYWQPIDEAEKYLRNVLTDYLDLLTSKRENDNNI
ncbi:MAG: hypothetical protein PHI12_02330 [Dehalococcoidales bacterium]|nr:hypothetical protein [Dehalococcoidales bacterium]